MKNIPYLLSGLLLFSGLAVAASGAEGTKEPLAIEVQKQSALLERIAADVSVLKSQASGANASRRGEPGFRALYTIQRDGSGVEFLAAAPGMISTATPEWSHHGTMIVYDCVPQVDELHLSHIGVYAVSGPFRGQFRDLGCGNVPSWSPDDRQITFMVNPDNSDHLKPGVWVMNADGTGHRWLCEGWYPRWSPDGKEICVHAYFESPDSLHLYELATGKIRKVLGKDIGVEFGGATWSADGKKLVLIIHQDGQQHIATIQADGNLNSLAILYTHKEQGSSLVGPPTLSPDGKQIVVAVQESARNQARLWLGTYLYTLSVDHPGSLKLLEGSKVGTINRGMMWSPDGTKIAFSSER